MTESTCARDQASKIDRSLTLPVGWAGAGNVHPLQVFGWLILLNKVGAEAFTDADAQAAATLGAQAGVAFENVRLVDRLQREAAALDHEIVNRTQSGTQSAGDLKNIPYNQTQVLTGQAYVEYFIPAKLRKDECR